MDCIAAVKRIGVWLGLLRSFSSDVRDDAETDNLIVDRERALDSISAENEKFTHRSKEVAADVERSKGDLEVILHHLKRVSSSAADARTLIEEMMVARKPGTRK